MTLVDFIWNKFSSYYHENDTNPDGDGKGTFQRFLSIFGLEIDEQVTPGIEGFLNNVDPTTAAEKFLPDISYSLGTPDDILGDTDLYRQLLTQVISLYQIKGTIRSYQLLFGMLGMSVLITELFPDENNYDTHLKYDDPITTIYDDDPCSRTCIHYALEYDNLPGNDIAPLTEELEEKLTKLIYDLIQPVGAELDTLSWQRASACGVAVNYAGSRGFPNIVDIDLSVGLGQVDLKFQTGSNPDKILIEFPKGSGIIVIDTGYRGDITLYQTKLNNALASRGLPPEDIVEWAGAGVDMTESFNKTIHDKQARAYIYSPLSGTGWNFRLTCPV